MSGASLMLPLLYPSGLFANADSGGEGSSQQTVSVVSSDSLASVVTKLARDYSRRSGVHISVSYGYPEQLAKTIFDGAKADVFISEDSDSIDSMKQEGMVDVFSTTVIAETSLDMVCGGELPLKNDLNGVLQSKKDLFRLAVCSADTCVMGKYSRNFIADLKQLSPYRDKITEIGTIQSLETITEVDGICGVFYSFMQVAAKSGLWKVALDESMLPEIKVKAAVVAGENMPVARGFLDYLKSRKAERIILSEGFITAGREKNLR